LSYYQIAKKAMVINISDAIAMNAKPKYALLSVAMPKNITKSQMKELAQGFQEVAASYGIEIIGGDTLSNTKLDITVTIISKTIKPLYRSGVKDGIMLAYTGTLGASAKELKKLFNLGSLHKKSKFINIKLREDFLSKTARLLAAGMDISDGLADDLAKLSKYNQIGFSFFDKMEKQLLCSGEEYEMLIAFDKRNTKSILRRACQSRVKINIFATATRAKYSSRCKSHHF